MQWDVKDLGLHKNALLQNAYDFNKKSILTYTCTFCSLTEISFDTCTFDNMSVLRWMKRIYSRTWTERYFLYNDSRVSSFRCDFRAEVKSPSVVNLKPEVKPRLEWKLNLPLTPTVFTQ